MQKPTLNYTVLLAVYHADKATSFDTALESIDSQTLTPSEIVLVEDGKLTDSLYEIIKKWKKKWGNRLVVKTLDENLGLAEALNCGLIDCSYTYVARMDSDDYALPDRFEKQLAYLQTHAEVDILGMQIEEYDETMTIHLGKRLLPQTHNEVKRLAQVRNPFNHVTVIYKKDKVLQLGGYPTRLLYFEDYALWATMLQAGCIGANLPDIGVKVRGGPNYFNRRLGWPYLKWELRFLRYLKHIGFLNHIAFIKSFLIRFSIRLLPKFLSRLIYVRFLRAQTK